ncbi:MAG: glycine cleavage system aminomethyltransferase GcvT, partial [Clostridia bacterium]
MAVRNACGLFDVSHMGEVCYRGEDALENLQRLLTNDMAGMRDGQVRYSPMCNDAGGVVDDLIVYRMTKDCYFVVVNAANREKDVSWMQAHRFGMVTVEDQSDGIAQLALQGPRATEILQQLTSLENIPKRYYSFVKRADVAGIPCMISRTGYTGEHGYELYCSPADAPALWERLLEMGAPLGLIPCGLGARDTLRLEAAMPLYGHEMSAEITPLEAGLSMFVKLDKPCFIGKEALLAKGEPVRKRVGLRMTGRGIAREQCIVYDGEAPIGVVTSGTHCPYLGQAVAMALLDASRAEIGRTVEVDVRGRRVAAQIVALPFYKKTKE